MGRNVGEGDVVETLEGGDRGVDLDNDLAQLSVQFLLRVLKVHTLSAIWISSGVAPTEAPGTKLPSSRISVASTTVTSRLLLGRSFV